ncbi:large ribosomal subunit protein eL20z-like [Rhododendron vialii]|uniref:large ribosomal subunit protein eL20z-like n=1 Tax=Rhododendron vialii TaxID=182163 RepID=UPI00265D9842|nr:large ribosomal subunit protein eL20z-like [Rhododendron vialii]
MNIEEGKERGATSGNSPQPGAANYPPRSVIWFPQPILPSAPPPPPQFYAHGYQTAQGYPVSEGIQIVKVDGPLPCCGIGIGWLLFILGLFVGVIPWYVGAIILLCDKGYDKREKPGLIACAIVGVIATIVIVVAVAIFYHT